MNQKTAKAIRKIANSTAGQHMQELAYTKDRAGTVKVALATVRGVTKNLKAQAKTQSKGRR